MSCHAALLDRGGSIKEGHFGFRHFVCEFYRRMDTVDMLMNFWNMPTVSIEKDALARESTRCVAGALIG
jgi:hypothetical protein